MMCLIDDDGWRGVVADELIGTDVYVALQRRYDVFHDIYDVLYDIYDDL